MQTSPSNAGKRLLSAERASAANLSNNFKNQVSLIEPRASLAQYTLYVQLDWLTSRDHIAKTFLCYTGDPSQTVKVAILQFGPTAGDLGVVQRIFSEYERDGLQYGIVMKRTPLGIAVCGSVETFGSAAVQCVALPDGDFEANVENLYVNVNLRRFSCGERTILTCRPPTQVIADKFFQLYSIDPSATPINAAVITLARTVQRALFFLGMLKDERWLDGLVCDMTIRALQQFHHEMGQVDEYYVEEGRWCDPALLSAVLGAMARLRYKLNTGAGVNTRDPYLEPMAFRNQLEAFQRQHGLPLSGLLDEATRHRIDTLAAAKAAVQPPAFVAPVVDVLHKLEDITGLPTGLNRPQKPSHRRNLSLQDGGKDILAAAGNNEWDNDINQIVQYVYTGIPSKSSRKIEKVRKKEKQKEREERDRQHPAERPQTPGGLVASAILTSAVTDSPNSSTSMAASESTTQGTADTPVAKRWDNNSSKDPRRTETMSTMATTASSYSAGQHHKHAVNRGDTSSSLTTQTGISVVTDPISDGEENPSFSSKGAAALRAPAKMAVGVVRNARNAVKNVRSNTAKLLAGNNSGTEIGDNALADGGLGENNSSNSQPSNSSNSNSNVKHHHHRGPSPVKRLQHALADSATKLTMSEEVLHQIQALRPHRSARRPLRRTRSLDEINPAVIYAGEYVPEKDEPTIPIPPRPKPPALPARPSALPIAAPDLPMASPPESDTKPSRQRSVISVSSVREFRRIVTALRKKTDSLSNAVTNDLTPLHTEATTKFTSIESSLNSRVANLGLAQSAAKDVNKMIDRLTREKLESTRGGLEERKRKVAFGLSLLEDRHREAQGLALAFDKQVKSLELRLAQDDTVNVETANSSSSAGGGAGAGTGAGPGIKVIDFKPKRPGMEGVPTLTVSNMPAPSKLPS
ncbi:hypothetical protein SmJEL517_g02854 [Synchytrium microbalum]|uniref:STB6-like N-terminal domain-containing protein n=1 Tax=Synchytrium microbalum TaxID=1806994 RepID=A0A507C5D8_9FUNG|nr:uncharacterized protein SmJEL517_g02854 [Synchytrium microbalum]TPX34588.1 hypothetical protein SmJEL517_g02854 [Synchytrium microbalum]